MNTERIVKSIMNAKLTNQVIEIYDEVIKVVES